MLLTISTTHKPASDLGYLLHKNLARTQAEELSFGKSWLSKKRPPQNILANK
jgi:hypothetical protein